jgi:hypothetical protein
VQSRNRLGRRRIGSGVVAAAFLALAFPAAARAEPVADQQQLVLSDSGRNIVVSGEQWLAQVVRSGRPGFLAAVSVPVTCSVESLPDATVVVEIRDTTLAGYPFLEPGDRVIATGTVLARNVRPPADGLFTVSVAPRVFMATGTPFTIVVRSDRGSCSGQFGPRGDPYPDGNGFFGARENNFRWACICYDGTFDLAFRTLVDPACIVPAVGGMGLAQARKELEENGCASGRVTRVYSKARKGAVIRQSPARGVELTASARVNLVVSKGKKPRKRRR